MDAKVLFPILFVTWIVLATAGLAWVSSRKNPADKRKALRVLAITAAVIFGSFVGLTMKPSLGMLFIGGALVFITYMNIKLVKVCDGCAAINRPQGLTPPGFCQNCGGKLSP